MPLSKPRLAVDMDEVMADANKHHVKWYAETFGYEWTAGELERSSIRSLVAPEHAEALERELQKGDVYGRFDVMPDSQAALAELIEHFDIFITTAAMEYPASCEPKFAWLQRHFPFVPALNIVFCGDKSILAADLLLDDNARHFEGFGGQGVLFSAPHNRTVEWPVRVNDWKDAVGFFTNWASTMAQQAPEVNGASRRLAASRREAREATDQWQGFQFLATKVDPMLPGGVLHVYWLTIQKSATGAKAAVEERVGHEWQVKLISEGQAMLERAKGHGLRNGDVSEL